MVNTSNRRVFSREKKNSRVRYSLLGTEDYHDARLVDLGEGGLCMETSRPLRTGQCVYVQLLDLHPEMPGLSAHRSFQGTVRWNRELGCFEKTLFGVGVQYTRPVSCP